MSMGICSYLDQGREPMGKSKLSIVVEFLMYLKHNKKWWLAPILIILIAFSLFIVMTSSSPVLPFVYTLF